MVYWKMAVFWKVIIYYLDVFGDTPIFHWTMIVGGRVEVKQKDATPVVECWDVWKMMFKHVNFFP